MADGGPASVGVVGGARLTNEGAYAWAKLAKGVLGTDSVDAQMGDGLPAELITRLPRATIDQAAAADTVIVLSGDVREELPVLFLRLRSAVVDGDLDIVELSPQATSLTPYAKASLRYGPGDATALARSLVDAAAAAPSSADPDAVATARELTRTPRIVIIAGRPVPGRGRRAWWARRSRRWPTPCPTPTSSPACAGATSTAPSTWAWPRACCPAG